VEVPPEDGSSRKRIGRPPSVGHFHEDMSPTYFCKILMAPDRSAATPGRLQALSRPGAREDDH
jgi:hypothetical protein